MAAYTDPIVVQIVDEVANVGNPNRNKKSGATSGDLAAGITKLGGIAALISEVVGMVKDAIDGILKPIKTVITGMLKLVTQFLRPIADIIIVLLQPLLMLLKPIVRLFNQLMQPFRKIAYDLMREAGTKEVGSVSQNLLYIQALGTLLSGILASMFPIIAQLITMFIVNPIFSLLEAVLPMFKNQLESAKNAINTGLINTGQTIYQATLDMVGKHATELENALSKQDLKTPMENWAKKVGTEMQAALDQYAIPKSTSRNTSAAVNAQSSLRVGEGLYNPNTGGYFYNDPISGLQSRASLPVKSNTKSIFTGGFP